MDLEAYGTALQIGNGATPELFTNIAQVADISGPSMSRDSIDTTTHQTTGHYKTAVPGLRDGGEVTFSLNFDPSLGTHDEATGIIAQYNDDLVHNYRLVYPQSALEGWAFSGFITKIDPKNPVDKQITADITIKISGKPTWGTF
jgi:predicted secreted protein